MFRDGNAWTAYRQLEGDLLEITKYVALVRQHDNVYSEKLADLMIRAGGLVDTTFRQMINYQGLNSQHDVEEKRRKVRNNRATIEDYRECFETYYGLSSLRVDVHKNNYGTICPFSEFASNSSPLWWRSYTKLKHDIFSNVNLATVSSGLSNIAALFLLNVFHMEAREVLVDHGTIKSELLRRDKVYGVSAPDYLKKLLTSDPKIIAPSDEVWIKTDLFFFSYPMRDRPSLAPFFVEEEP
jgi:hypothetical protein